MNKSLKILILLLIPVLIILNIIQYQEEAAPQKQNHRVNPIAMKSLILDKKALPDEQQPTLYRDIFYPKIKAITTPAIQPQRDIENTVALIKPDMPSPQEIARQQAEAELSQFRFIGAAYRDGKGQAFLTKGERSIMVGAGDTIDQRFIVKKVDNKRILIKDKITGLVKEIQLSGE